MATISSPGLGSGLDVRKIVEGLVAAEGQPATSRLDRQESKLQATLSALGSVKSSLSQFQSAVSGLSYLSTFQNRTAVSSQPELFTATAVGQPSKGEFDVEVKQLAQSHKLASAGVEGVNTVIGTGDLVFQYGDPSKPANTVTIDESNNTLAGIRDAVNAANIGVRASVVNGDNGYQLVFSAANSGADNSLRISVQESPLDGTNTDMNGLSRLAFDPAEGISNMTETAAANNAEVVIDGITVTRATNTISDALAGVTLKLLKAEEGTKGTLSLGSDNDAGMAAVEKFVSAFNDMAKNFNDLTSYNPETREAAILTGDVSVRGISSQLRNILGAAVPGLEGGLRALSDLGIKTQRDGTLSLDKTRLSTAMDQDISAVARVFAEAGVSSQSSVSYLSAGDNVREGSHEVVVTQLASRGQYLDAASSVSSTLVNADNNTLRIRIDGVQSGVISLTEKTYASKSELAAEIQSRINGDTTIKAAGVSVVVNYDSDTNRFSFTSERYGSNSTVEITQTGTNGADIGLTANSAASQTGVDVAGTIGGVAATGSGQTLTGTGIVQGLALLIQGDTLGSRGTVTYTRGVASRLNEVLDGMLGQNNMLDARTGSIRSQINGIDAQRETLDKRLATLEERYMRQFTALDTMLVQMQSTSNYLASQLASLSGA